MRFFDTPEGVVGIILLAAALFLVRFAARVAVRRVRRCWSGPDSKKALLVPVAQDDGENPSAPHVYYLGNPLKPRVDVFIQHRYARNVWDMQLWDGKIYLGYGNSSNYGPAPNAGPIRVIAYDPRSGRFESEFTTDEEQIDRYRIIQDRLYIPGHDPRDSWEWGNFYRLNDDGWEKVRTIPRGIHTYDMLDYGDYLFAVLGTKAKDQVVRSSDGGQTWEGLTLHGVRRAFELFTLNDKLYVHAYRRSALFCYNGDGFDHVEADLFPSARTGRNPMMVRSVLFDGVLLYIGANNVNDHQWTPCAAYKAEEIERVKKLESFQGLPFDILVRDGNVYILTSRFDESESDYTSAIYRSDDLEHWDEVARINAPSFARSFELYKGLFYIGLGTSAKALNKASGDIYRVAPQVL